MMDQCESFPQAVFEQKPARAAQGTSIAVQDIATSRWFGRTEAGSGRQIMPREQSKG